MNDFANRLKQFRWSHNMTIKEFSETLNMNMNTYHSVESGYRKPTIKLLKELVLVYNINLNDWILDVG